MKSRESLCFDPKSCSRAQIIMLPSRLGCQEGTLGEIRGRLEATEREKAELQQKLAQFMGYQAGPGMGTVPYLGTDLKKQLEMVHQQLAFKDQEVRGIAILVTMRCCDIFLLKPWLPLGGNIDLSLGPGGGVAPADCFWIRGTGSGEGREWERIWWRG